MWKQQVSALTASGDTTKTLIDTFTVPDGVSQIIGVTANLCAGATLTSGEPVTGLIELESDDAAVTPAQFISDIIDILTSGAISYAPKQWPCAIKVKPGNRIKAYVTMDLAQTGALKCRIALTYA